jgi:uncharacterized protein (TIGR03118 family)
MRYLLIFGLMLGLYSQANAQTNSYTVTNIVDNTQDAYLLNPWGLSRVNNPNLKENEWWASDNLKGTTTLYYANKTGSKSLAPLIITIPSASGTGLGSPTGTAYYAGVGPGPGANNFAFATLDGTISNWNAGTGGTGSGCASCHVTTATIKVNNSASGASYQGLTITKNSATSALTYYAANSNGGVEAYDATKFTAVTFAAGAFTDPHVPTTYSPAGIQAIGGKIYVTYNAIAGGGTGYVSVYNTTGKLVQRLQAGMFNQPWGVVLAPASFGLYSGAILVGNTGSGWIGAYNATNGQFMDFLRDSTGALITIPGLWALSFGNGSAESGPTNVLYFTAGGPNLTTGVFGAITAN